MLNIFRREVIRLSNKSYVDTRVIKQVLKRLQKGKLIKKENPEDHFCSFFLPVDTKNKMIYLVNHKKAQDWIPPGGHIEMGEQPVDTVKREFKEELGWNITKRRITLFDISITKLKNVLNRPCKIHNDFWYIVLVKKTNFKFDAREFYDARWFTIEDAVVKMNSKQFKKTIIKVSKIFKL